MASTCARVAAGLLVVAPLVLAPVGRSAAGDEDLPLEQRVRSLLVALSFHKSKAMAAEGPLVIAIVHDPKAGPEIVRDALAAFQANAELRIGKKSFRTVELSFEEPALFKAALQKHGVGVVYITAESRAVTRLVLNVTRELKILSITAVSDYVHWLGSSLGVEVQAGKPKLVVNLSACKGEGVEFDARLLQLASVYF